MLQYLVRIAAVCRANHGKSWRLIIEIAYHELLIIHACCNGVPDMNEYIIYSIMSCRCLGSLL